MRPLTKRNAPRARGAGVDTERQTSPQCSATGEAPEHGGRWHAFIVWAVMGGWCSYLRLVERVLADVEAEGAR